MVTGIVVGLLAFGAIVAISVGGILGGRRRSAQEANLFVVEVTGYGIVMKGSPFDSDTIRRYCHDYAVKWSQTFGVPAAVVVGAIHGLMVEWKLDETGKTRGFKNQRGSSVAGEHDMVNLNLIRVGWVQGDTVGWTAFGHELTHYLLWKFFAEPDPDHALTAGFWDHVWKADHDLLIDAVDVMYRTKSDPTGRN